MSAIRKVKIFIVIAILITNSFAQWEDDTQCGFSLDSTNLEFIETIGTLENTNLKIGLLMVQFSDWETNINARGGVGWDDLNYNIVNSEKN